MIPVVWIAIQLPHSYFQASKYTSVASVNPLPALCADKPHLVGCESTDHLNTFKRNTQCDYSVLKIIFAPIIIRKKNRPVNYKKRLSDVICPRASFSVKEIFQGGRGTFPIV